MKIFKHKYLFFAGLVVIVLLIGSLLFLQNSIFTTIESVKILDRSYSVCTMDVPPSSCGPYEVTVLLASGDEHTYTVEGFDDDKSERYNDISARITNAQNQKDTVTVTIDRRGNIIAIE